jgi:hypothetical protein
MAKEGECHDRMRGKSVGFIEDGISKWCPKDSRIILILKSMIHKI